LTGPFEATIPGFDTFPVVGPLTRPPVVRYQTLTPGPDAGYGLDKPYFRVKVTIREPKFEPPGPPGRPPLPPSFGPELSRTLVVGGPTPEGDGRYARFENGPNAAVFVVPREVGDVGQITAL